MASFYTPSPWLSIHSPSTQTIVCICARIKPCYMACGHLSLSWKSLYGHYKTLWTWIDDHTQKWPIGGIIHSCSKPPSRWVYHPADHGTSFGDSWIPPREILGPSEPIIEKPVPSSCTWSNIEKRSWKQILVIVAIMTHMLLEEPTNCRMFSEQISSLNKFLLTWTNNFYPLVN